MKILFLSRLYRPHVGGVEKHIEEISKILKDRHQITLVTEQHNTRLPLYEKYPEITVHRIPVSDLGEKTKKFYIWKWWLSHLDLVSTADIVHIHDVFFWLMPFKLLFMGKKMFITFHGYEGSENPGKKQIIWHKLGEWSTRGNICIGDFHRKWYHIRPDIVSYGAVSVMEKNKSPRKPDGKILYLGRLATDTGIMDYLAGIKNHGISLDIYGDGPLRNQAEAYCKKHSVNAKFFGFVPNADRLISGYSVILTSRYLGILEALAASIPVIAHYDSEIKHDYLSMAPFARYIDICKNPAEISQAIKPALSKTQQLRARVSSGYNWAKLQTWEKLAENYEQLWNEKIQGVYRS